MSYVLNLQKSFPFQNPPHHVMASPPEADGPYRMRLSPRFAPTKVFLIQS